MVASGPAAGPTLRSRATDVVVLGMGGDRGHGEVGTRVGTRVLDLIRGLVPAEVRLLAATSLGRDLADLDGATHVLVIDSVDVGREPGAVVLFDGDMLSPCIAQVMMRDLEIVHYLVLAGQHADAPEEIALLGVQSAVTGAEELSERVEAALPVLAEEAVGVIRSWLDPGDRSPASRAEPPDC